MPVLLEMPKDVESPAARPPSPRGALLLRVLAVLEREKIPCCLLHGYETVPQTIDGDVDCLIPGEFLPNKLAKVLHASRGEVGARVVQWFSDGAHFIVLAGRNDDGSPLLLQMHVSTQYEMAGRVFFDGNEILAASRRHGEFRVPAAGVEFTCVLANKAAKGALSDDHGRRLSALFAVDPAACTAQMERFLQPDTAKVVIDAARSGDWRPVQVSIDFLRQQLLKSPATRPAGRKLARLAAKIVRWLRPRNGFHAVFLGPDGVAKTTTIEQFQRDLSPAFLHSQYLTFAPGLLPQKFVKPKPDGPHSLPPRSFSASLVKAAWWAVCYTLGYCATVRPVLARGGLVVNHRYLVDAIIDQKRYRYSGPVWLLKMIWAISPKPDVVFLLDASPQVIQRRKQEVPFEETAQQVEAYRTIIGRMPLGRIIDAAQPREQVATEVEWLVLDRLAQRVARQFSLGVSE